MRYRFIPSFFLYRNWVYGQVTRKSSCPKLCRTNPELCRPKFWVKSPEMFGYVAWNFIMLKNILTSLWRFFWSHQTLKNEIYYSFIALVYSRHRFKNEVLCTLFIKILNDMTQHFGRLDSCFRARWHSGRLDRLPRNCFFFLFSYHQSQSEILLFTRQSRNLQLR